MKLDRNLIENLIYGIAEIGVREDPDVIDHWPRRFTQDSPVLPDVWIRYGEKPNERHDLLLTPRFGSTAGEVSAEVRHGVGNLQQRKPHREPPDIAYNQTYVTVRLYFDELVRVVLPMTRWWQENVSASVKELPEGSNDQTMDILANSRDFLLAELKKFGRGDPGGDEKGLKVDLLWMMRIIGTIAWAQSENEKKQKKATKQTKRSERARTKPPTPQQMVDAIVRLLRGVPLTEEDAGSKIWQVSLNRPARIAVQRSSLAVKADAARRLFKVRCRDLTWAIIDSGIDARHPAFWDWRMPADVEGRKKRIRQELDEIRETGSCGEHAAEWPRYTRVKETYDFTRSRELLSPSFLTPEAVEQEDLPDFVQQALDRADAEGNKPELKQKLEEHARRLRNGWGVDWGLARLFLKIPHVNTAEPPGYKVPRSEHGTHVAGILAADWPEVEMEGICPDIGLYDLRVVSPQGPNEEFAVLSALQFLTYLNNQKDYFAVHGANLSLSIRHDVANFACGRTPVCDECERVVSSGVVVVAAAGNDGYLQYMLKGGKTTEGYHTVSITDPGNADKVITVGSTHRFQPHTYGVSYFSSRGPTGDGRIKPDLVAPGEKIDAPVPGAEKRVKDGTSMSAPHVSGAAAMLIARHSEMVGQPERVKKVLCDTATDLGRERYFQGAGMLDVLRALQSI